LAAFITTVQEAPAPLHAPPQPENFEPGAGVAVRVTLVPRVTDAPQASPQSIQSDSEVTAPLPLPVLLMASGNVVGGMVVGTEVVDVVGCTVVVGIVVGTEVGGTVVGTELVDVAG